MRLISRIFLILAVVFATSTATAPVFADAREDAAVHFKRGTELYGEGDFRAALIEFRRAYQLAPHFKVLFNIGQVQYQLGDYAGAMKTLQQYLDEGGTRIEPDRRAVVEADIERLKDRVAYVTVVTDVEDAKVFVDDIEVGTTPLGEPIAVSAGRRKIAVRKQGYRDESQYLDLAGGDRREVELSLESIVTQPLPAPAPVTPRPEEPSAEVPWGAWATTAGFGAGCLVFGLLALNAKANLDEAKRLPTTAETLDEKRTQMLAFAVVTDILAAGAVITGSVAIYLTATAGDEPANAPSAAITVSPAGLGLSGTF